MVFRLKNSFSAIKSNSLGTYLANWSYRSKQLSAVHSMLHSPDSRAAIATRMKTVKQIGVVALSLLVVTAWLIAILYFWFVVEF